jgi:MFS family permease
MYYHLASLDRELSDKDIATQAGILNAVFALGACITAVYWGKLSQIPCIGRKGSVSAGLVIGCLSCLGIAFATRFYQMVIFQTIGGIAAGNIGVVRTAILEIIPDKRFITPLPSLSRYITSNKSHL